MAETCCNVAGGRVVIKVNGTQLEIDSEADVTITLPLGKEVKSTSSGRAYAVKKAKPVEVDLTFIRGCGVNPEDFFNDGCSLNVTIQEIDRGVTHYFTNATLTGDPELNITSGELSGIKLACGASDYQRMNS